MKRLAALMLACASPVPVALVVLAPVVAVAPGCSTPAKAYSTANETFIAVVQQLLALKAGGKISQDKWEREILPQINRGNELMRAWRKAVDANATGQPDYKALLKAVIDALIAYELQHGGNQ